MTGVCRSAATAAACRSTGVAAYVAGDAAVTDAVADATHVVSTVGPGAEGDAVLDAYATAIRGAKPLAWLAYVSSTGVYGDHGGARLDETAELRASGARGGRRARAEAAWAELHARAVARDARLCVFRLAGVYGPERSALDTLLGGRDAGHARGAALMSSRIHVDDVVSALASSALRSDADGIFNVADDLPASRREVFAYAQTLIPAHRRLTLPNNIPQRQRERDSDRVAKNIANDRMRRLLLPDLYFPTYKHGLRDLAARYGLVTPGT